MTNSQSFLTLSFCMIFLLIGCSNDTNEHVIASEKTLPGNFHELAFEREKRPLFQYLIRKAVNHKEFEQLWNLYGFKNNKPDVNWDEHHVFFIGVHESGSCPYEVKHVDIRSDKVRVELLEPAGACTDDATPRTFVIELDKEISKDIRNVVMVQSRAETSIAIETP